MGDFTTETLYICPPDMAAQLEATTEVDAAFETLAEIHSAGGARSEYKSYSYEQDVYLPMITQAYRDRCGPELGNMLGTYAERPCVVTRTAMPGHADAVLHLLEGLEAEPERLLPHLLEQMKQTLASATRTLPKESDTSFMAVKFRESHAALEGSVRDFSLTGDVLREVLRLSPEGGFYPGDGPDALQQLGDRHTPNSNLLRAVGHSFGFLKTLAPLYRTAEKDGQCVLHLQVYGT